MIATVILVFLGSILGAGAGYAAAATIGYAIAGAMGMSDFEGGRAMFAVFFAGPVGGIAGFFLGVWLGLRLRRRHSFEAVLGYSALSVVMIGAVGAAIAGVIYFMDAPIYRDGSRFALEFEIRLPANAKLPARMSDIWIEMFADKNRISAQFDYTETRRDGERTVLVGDVELYHLAWSRALVLAMPDEPKREFRLPLAVSPRIFEEFTPWARVDTIDATGHPRKASPEPADDFEIRYRLPDPRKPVAHIAFEVRLPPGTRLGDSYLPFHTGQRRDDGEDWGYYLHKDSWKRLEGDHPVLIGGMSIVKPNKHPKFTLKLLDGPLRVFDLDFPAEPVPTPDFGPWKPAAALEDPGQPPRPPGPDDPRFELRYRIDAPRPFRG